MSPASTAWSSPVGAPPPDPAAYALVQQALELRVEFGEGDAENLIEIIDAGLHLIEHLWTHMTHCVGAPEQRNGGLHLALPLPVGGWMLLLLVVSHLTIIGLQQVRHLT